MSQEFDTGTRFTDVDSVTLGPIASKKYRKGKKYEFFSPDGDTGRWVQKLMSLGQRAAFGDDTATGEMTKLVLDDDEEMDLYKKMMGDTLTEMLSDGVSWGHITDLFGLLLRHWGQTESIQVALAAGEAQTQPNRAARRASGNASSPKAGSKSSRTSSATKAPTAGRVSTRSSGTSAARKTPARKTA